MKEMPDTAVLPPPCLPPLQQQPSWKPTAPLKRGLRDTRIHKAFTRAIRLEYVSLFVSLSLSRSLSVSVLSLPLSLSPARHLFLPSYSLSISAFLSVSLSVPVSLSLVISLDLFFSSPYSLTNEPLRPINDCGYFVVWFLGSTSNESVPVIRG